MTNSQYQRMQSNFSGLWLDDPTRLRDPEYRGALLFVVGPDQDYVIRFTLSLITEQDRREFSREEIAEMEETAGDILVSDYKASSNFITQHPHGMEEDVRIEVPWRRESDGSLALRDHDDERWEYFLPATFEDLYKAGFSRKFVAEVLSEIEEKGWHFQLVCGVPSSGLRRDPASIERN